MLPNSIKNYLQDLVHRVNNTLSKLKDKMTNWSSKSHVLKNVLHVRREAMKKKTFKNSVKLPHISFSNIFQVFAFFAHIMYLNITFYVYFQTFPNLQIFCSFINFLHVQMNISFYFCLTNLLP